MFPRLRLFRRPVAAGAIGPDEADPAERSNYRNLLWNGACFGFIDAGILSFLPVYLARLGATASQIGMLTAGPSLAGILFYIPGGAYAERRSNLVRLVVRSALVTRLCLLGISFLPFLLLPEQIPAAAIALWTLGAIPNAIYVPAWTTVMQQAISPERRARLNGTRWSLYSLVSSLGLAAFGLLLDRMPSPAGYQVVFTISFVAGVLGLFFFSRLLVAPFVASPSTGERTSPVARARAYLRTLTESRVFVRYTLGTLPFRLLISLPAGFYSIYWVNNLNATDSWIGLRGTAGYAALVLAYPIWGRVANRIGHRALLFIAGAGFSLYPVVTALAPNAYWLLPAAVIWGLTVSGMDIGMFDMLLASCPEGRQPTFAAVSSMLTSIVSFAGPLLGAAMVQFVPLKTALLVSGALQLVTVAFFFLLPNREQEGLAHR